ncbi:hypothetical protein [Taibaiella soli]|nr:hypothetical protein [Taibaiella soli]
MKYLKLLLALCMATFALKTMAGSKLDKKKDAAVAEGKWLFRSESTSWYGTDIFMANYSNTSKIGGYFSYPDGNQSKCIFYSREEHPRVIGTISFNETIDADHGFLDLMEREFTPLEKDYYTISYKVKQEVVSDTSFFRYYANVNYNIIPKIDGDSKLVYIIMGAKDNAAYYGNDYLLTFNKHNELTQKERLHKSILRFGYGEESNNNDGKVSVTGPIHTHLPEYSDIMTPTDICTTMLYEKLAGWGSCIVISKDYVSIWSCKTDQLLVITKDAFEKIAKDAKNR